MFLESRDVTEADLPLVIDIANSNILAVNPNEKRLGEMEAGELIKGFFEPAITRLTKFSSDDEWQSFIAINPDKARGRFYCDIYTRPGSATLDPSFELALQLAREYDSTFQFWPGVQSLDFNYKGILERRGFTLLRRYWTMQMHLPSLHTDSTLGKGSIREIDVMDDDDVRTYYEIQQDSFSRHFGFAPREFSDWCRLVRRSKEEANERVWIISLDGQDAGFMDCNDEMLHEGSGYVSGLGVKHDFQGRGLGEALLRFAIELHSEKGLEALCLNVDAGNESGALRLYEKVGMKPISEWHQYENSNWKRT